MNLYPPGAEGAMVLWLELTLVKKEYQCSIPTISILGGGAVAEWSKAPLVRENKLKIKKIPGSPPDLGTF